MKNRALLIVYGEMACIKKWKKREILSWLEQRKGSAQAS